MRCLMMSPVVAMVAMTLVAAGHADIPAAKTSTITRPKIEIAPEAEKKGSASTTRSGSLDVALLP